MFVILPIALTYLIANYSGRGHGGNTNSPIGAGFLSCWRLVFVTGRGGAGFHSPDPALTRGRGGYVSGNPRPAPVRGPPGLMPWTGPRLLAPIFNGDLSGVWVGWGPERRQEQGMPKKTPRPRPLSGAGRGKGPGARVFRGPVRPVTNSTGDIVTIKRNRMVGSKVTNQKSW